MVTAPVLHGSTGTEAATGSGAGPEPGRAGNRPEPVRQIAAQYWQRWRLPFAVIAFILIGGIAIAFLITLAPPPRPHSYLHPARRPPDGRPAPPDVLSPRGLSVLGTNR